MIGPKIPKPTKAEENDAYELCTLRDRGACVRCRRVHPIWGVNRDHRMGRGVGGRTIIENLQVLCGSGTEGCHGWKTRNPEKAVREGYTVPSWADPAEFPAARWFPDGPVLRLGWCLYRADGTVHEIPEAEALARMEGLW
jgi:hypothetical protein